MPDIPTNNIELYLANIAGESDRTPDFPTNKIERYLAKIVENGGGGGGGGEGPEPYTDSPAMDGTASAGSSANYARGDHVHPTDTSRAAASDLANKADRITEVTVSTAGAVTQALDAEKIYHFTGAVTALTITLNEAATGQLAHYHLDFNSGSTAATLTLPNTVTMPSGFTVEASKHYEINILNNFGAVMSW